MVDTTNQAPAGARRVVLLGQGISYSASPAMQSAAFAAAGLNWRYEVLDVPPDGLAAAVEALREPLYAGANVTIPHKVAVMRLLDELEGDALAAGAVNTIRRDGARLVGSNTDVVGI
ncbi:MAG: shikimate dehydrogenase, partial [Candidatus Dormibacteraeota bacterium]|nr:shikimate dehydrogenase [Candidatus Dormibacteraeota bacterium]